MKLSFDYPKLALEPRFIALTELVGGDDAKALKCVCRFWNTALEYWARGRKYIPAKIFRLDKDWHHLIEVDLAEVRDNGDVYAKGSEDAFGWILDLQASKHAGGVASAKARLEKYGTAQPQKAPTDEQNVEHRSGCSTEQNSNSPEQDRTGSNASIFMSSSVSTSVKKKRTLPPTCPDDEKLAQEWFEMACRYSTTVHFGPEWPDTVRKLREIDKLTPETIRELLAFVEADDFWRPNALSIAKLRTRSKNNGLLKWENALAKMREETERHGLGGGADAWAGFEEACAKLEAR